MTAPDHDPIEEALRQVADGLAPGDAQVLRQLVDDGLEAMDTTAPADFLAREEIAPAADLPPDQRLDWAREFAMTPVTNRLNAQALELVRRLVDDGPSDELAERASELLDQLEAIDPEPLGEERRRRVYRRRNEAIADARWVMSGGEGPASLRAGRFARKH